MFAFTLLGASATENLRVDEIVAGQRGVCTFHVQGAMYRRLGKLLPPAQGRPLYAQIYVANTDMDVRVQHQLTMTPGLDVAVLAKIEAVMQDHNQFVRQFLNDCEVIRRERRRIRQQMIAERHFEQDQDGKDDGAQVEQAVVVPDLNFTIRLHARPGDDVRTHNLPTTSDMTAAMVEDGNSGQHRDIPLYSRNNNSIMRIWETREEHDPLQHPLLFPYGELG